MSMTFLNQLGVIPAVLIALACALILRGSVEVSKRRLLLFLLGVGVLLLSALLITMHFFPGQQFFQLSNLLAPSVLGTTALIMLNLKELAFTDRKIKITATLLGAAMIILFGLLWSSQLGVGYLILPGALILATGWAMGRWRGWLALALGLVSVGILFMFGQFMSHPPNFNENPPSPVVSILFLFVLYVIPGLAVVTSGVLMTVPLQVTRIPGENTTLSRPSGTQLAKIGFALLVLLYLAYTIFWGSIWDHTNDGLFGVTVSQLSAIIATGTGMIMTCALRGRNRLAGLLFLVAAPLILYQSFEAGWRVSYHEITEGRAGRIADALDKFYEREGYYPQSLDALTPRDLLFLRQPVILAGEEWCYESGRDYYRLSAFYREFFSAPVSLHIYESAGELPTDPSICESRLAEMKEKYYSPMEDPNAMQPPLPTPLPEIEVDVPRTEIQPVLDGAVALPGSWSTDGVYFLFGTQTDHLALHFLAGETGEVCTSDIHFSTTDGIWENSAWLPDGRLLYLESTGEMAVLTPCQLGSEKLTAPSPDAFDRVLSYSQGSSRILLKSQSSFWILDGRSLDFMQILDVTPNPYEFHWDTSTWLSDGDHLVIARLNGQKDGNEGATLYLIDGMTGAIQNSLILDGEFGQSAPWIEGLSGSEVLVHSQGELLIADFSVEPVKITNVLEDIFGLDINYPDEISAAGSHNAADGYYLAVRLNHPRNQSTYLYDSGTGNIHIYDHKYHTLLLFPDGYVMEMSRFEDVPTYHDEYDIVMVDDPDTTVPGLTFTGHVPREYPHLSIEYLLSRSQLAVGSAHGISLISLSDGHMEKYWTLAGDGFSPWLIAAPDGLALVAGRDFGGLYNIPLP